MVLKSSEGCLLEESGYKMGAISGYLLVFISLGHFNIANRSFSWSREYLRVNMVDGLLKSIGANLLISHAELLRWAFTLAINYRLM